jgi:hypothetical protein
MVSWKFLIILVLSIKLTVSARLEVSNDDVVIEAIRENRNLVILFGENIFFFLLMPEKNIFS